MAHPVGAVAHLPQAAAQATQAAAKPPANVAKVTPQDTVNISAAGKAASEAKAATKTSGDANHTGNRK